MCSSITTVDRSPGHIPAGRIDETSVHDICGFAPMFYRLAGASMDAGDGVDIHACAVDRGRPNGTVNPVLRQEVITAKLSRLAMPSVGATFVALSNYGSSH